MFLVCKGNEPRLERLHQKHVQMLAVTQLWSHPLIASLICNGDNVSPRSRHVRDSFGFSFSCCAMLASGAGKESTGTVSPVFTYAFDSRIVLQLDMLMAELLIYPHI